MSMKYGLIRVSTKEQNEARQVESMKKQGIHKDNIKIEKESGRSFDRDVYKSLKKALKEGDYLYIESVDRLGRTYESILQEWRTLTRRKKVRIKVISQPLLDTAETREPLIMQFIKDVLLLVYAYNAEQEYLNIKTRQAHGIAIAQKTGKKFGRPPKKMTKKTTKVIEEWQTGHITLAEAMQKLNVKKSAFYKYVEKIQDGGN